jgi:hypothetical protein
MIAVPLLYFLTTGPVIYWAMDNQFRHPALYDAACGYLAPIFIAIYEGPGFVSTPLVLWALVWGWHE